MSNRDSMTTVKQPARSVRRVMSDGSTAYDVAADLDGRTFIFACQTAGHANDLARAINQAVWIEEQV